jgi:signal transduction histidine kinase
MITLTMQTETIPAGTFVWIILGLCAAISAMAVYIAKQAEQRRKDDREVMERNMIDAKEVREVMLQVVKDNTAAMGKLTGAVDRMQKTFDTYIHDER